MSNAFSRAPSRGARTQHARRSARAVGVALLCAWLAVAMASTAPALEAEPPRAPSSESAEKTRGWQRLESVAEGFRAWVPGPIREEFNERRTYAGMVSEKKYFGEADGHLFSVGLHTLPNLGKWFAPTSLVLSHAKKNVLATHSGRELSFERRRMGDYPGGILTYAPEMEDAPFDVMEVHMVLVGQRLYILKASDPDLGADRSAVDRFFESFEVIR